MESGDNQANLNLVYTLTKNVSGTMDQLSKMGFVWGKDNQFVGALWPRSNRAENFKSGVGYVDTYLAYIKEKGLPVTLMLNTAADDLIVERRQSHRCSSSKQKRQKIRHQRKWRRHSDNRRFQR